MEDDEEKEEKTVKEETGGKFSAFNWARTIVSGKKNRMVWGRWDLDLTYITNRIIACGFPAWGAAAMYRNSKKDLIDFFKAHHGQMVKIYNLCAEDPHWYD